MVNQSQKIPSDFTVYTYYIGFLIDRFSVSRHFGVVDGVWDWYIGVFSQSASYPLYTAGLPEKEENFHCQVD